MRENDVSIITAADPTPGPSRPRAPDYGVSEVVGEMLMIGLAILLIATLSSVAGNFIPATRDPVVTIALTNDTAGNITLWHQGGDWIPAGDLKVIVGDDINRRSFAWNRTWTDANRQFLMIAPQEKEVFDLGSNITVITGGPLAGNETVSLVTPRSQVFSGSVPG